MSVIGACQKKKDLFLEKYVSWCSLSLEIWRVIVRRKAAAPEAEWKSGLEKVVLLWAPACLLLLAGQESCSSHFMPH